MRAGRLRSDEDGQALAIVVAIVAVLTVLPIGAQLLASGQAPISGQAVAQQQAIEAARAGVSDYVDHVETVSGYLQYCSPVFCTGGSVDPSNPAFAPDLGLSTTTWSTVDATTGNAAFQYAVDTSGISTTPTGPQQFPIYVTGRAGSPGHYVSDTLKVLLQVTPASQTFTFTGAPTGSCSNTTLSQYEDAVTVPIGATYAKVTVAGAQGGGTGTTAGGGENGGEAVTWVPATAGTTWTAVPGYAGASAGFALLSLFSGGGPGGCGGMDFGGGAGGGSAVGVISGGGGGGAAASALCLGTETQCTSTSTPSWCTSAMAGPCLLAVGGGGGGTGGTGNTTTAVGGAQPSQQGAPGAGALVALACGYGGGGGGGFDASSGDGGSGGSAGTLDLLGLCLGDGTGGASGGSGYATGSLSTGGCTGDGTSTVQSYPVPGGSGPNGAVTITFYTGTTCATTPTVQLSVSAVLTQQVAANTT